MIDTATLLESNTNTCGVSVELLTLSPDQRMEVAEQTGYCRLFFVLNGILACTNKEKTLRVLPREVLRSDGNEPLHISNVSKADAITCLQVSLLRSSSETLLPFYHRYFPDDSKQNSLCTIAISEGNKNSFRTDANVELGLAALKKYDTVVLQREESDKVFVVTLRGQVMVGNRKSDTLTAIDVSDETSVMITGQNDSEVLTIRVM